MYIRHLSTLIDFSASRDFPEKITNAWIIEFSIANQVLVYMTNKLHHKETGPHLAQIRNMENFNKENYKRATMGIDFYRLCARSVVSERFQSELFQKAPELFTQFNENYHRPRLRTKTKNFIQSDFFLVRIVFIFTVVKLLENDIMCT